MGYLVNTITGWGGQGLQGCHPRGSRGLMEYPGWSSLLENIVLLLVIVPAQSGVRSGRKPPDFYNFFFLEDFLRALPGTNSSLCSRQNPKFLDFRFIHKVPKSRICAHGAFLHNNLKIRTILRNGTVCILSSTVYKITKSNAADNDEKKAVTDKITNN